MVRGWARKKPGSFHVDSGSSKSSGVGGPLLACTRLPRSALCSRPNPRLLTGRLVVEAAQHCQLAQLPRDDPDLRAGRDELASVVGRNSRGATRNAFESLWRAFPRASTRRGRPDRAEWARPAQGPGSADAHRCGQRPDAAVITNTPSTVALSATTTPARTTAAALLGWCTRRATSSVGAGVGGRSGPPRGMRSAAPSPSAAIPTCPAGCGGRIRHRSHPNGHELSRVGCE